MAFTDENLKFIKDSLATDDYVMHDICDDNTLIALIARLEAAESLIRAYRQWETVCKAAGMDRMSSYRHIPPAIERWRKAAGKE